MRDPARDEDRSQIIALVSKLNVFSSEIYQIPLETHTDYRDKTSFLGLFGATCACYRIASESLRYFAGILVPL